MNHSRKLLLSILLAASLTATEALAKQVVVTVGTGTSQSCYAPYGNQYKYNTVQMIYTKDELKSTSGPIKALAFDVSSIYSFTTQQVQIYIGTSSTTSFSSKTDNRSVSGMTLVYEGAPTLGACLGWETIEFQKDFNYDGKSNLVVVIGMQSPSYTSTLKYSVTSINNKCLRRGDWSTPEKGLPSDETSAYQIYSYRPNTQFIIGEEELVTKNNIIYKVFNNEAYVKSYTSSLTGAVTIPASISFNGVSCNVVSINTNAFNACNRMTALTIPSTVTKIGQDALKGCTSLKEVTLKDGTSKLYVEKTTVDGKTVTQLPGIFNDCPLEKVYLGRDLTYHTSYSSYCAPFKGKTTLTDITIGSKVTEIGNDLFYGCSGITQLTIPANVTRLGTRSFASLKGLKELNIADGDTPLDVTVSSSTSGVFYSSTFSSLYLGRELTYTTTSSGKAPFYNRTSITNVTVGSKVKSIADYMFYGCKNLKTISNQSTDLTLTAGDEGNGYIAYYADRVMNGDEFGVIGGFRYYGMKGVKTLYEYVGTETEVTVPAGYLLMDKLFYANDSLTSITFSAGLKRISKACMERCTSLTSVTIPSSVEEIDDYAFFYCTSLTSLTLPAKLKRLGAHSLQFCSALTEVNIPSTLTTLEDFCLSRTAITSLTIPSSVTRIEGGVFHWCRSLTEVNLPSTLKYIGPFAFKYCSELTSIDIPAGVDSIATHAFYYCPKMTHVTLHEGLKEIGDFGFYGSGIVNINLPNTLTRIGKYGLAQNDFTHLTLPAGLKKLENAALYGNSNLTAISIPSGITELSDRVLSSCSKLNDITFPSTLTKIGMRSLWSVPMKNVKWPNHITTIGYQAMGGNGNGSHVIPKSVTDIDCMVFYSVADGNSFYCYSESMLPEEVFQGQVLLKSTLYVLPQLVEQYRASELGKRFKDIMPIGDANGDGELTIADITDNICYLTENRPADINGKAPGARDANGDGVVNDTDINVINQGILSPTTATTTSTLKSLANVVPFDIATEASENCQLLQGGGCLEWDGPDALDLINQLRWEACLEGIWWNGYGHLSMDKFHTYTWSTDLERIARVRVVEAYYSRYHERLNGKGWSSVEFNDLTTSSECLAFYSSFLGQMMSYYGEKNSLMTKGSGETGHYIAMITPGYKYIGMAGMDGTATLQFSNYDKAGNETSMLEPTGNMTFYVDVKDSYITQYEWIGIYNSSRVTENISIKDGEYLTLRYSPVMQFTNQVGYKRGFYMIKPGMTYTSSNPEVAKVDTESNRIIGVSPGTTTITATCGDITSTMDVTVTCNHEYEYSKPNEALEVNASCTKCGESIEVSVPTVFWVFFWTGNSGIAHPRDSYTVGETIKVSYRCDDGTDPYKKLLIECDKPELLNVPYHAEDSTEWEVLGAGDVTLKVSLQYNPKRYRTYKLHLVNPE